MSKAWFAQYPEGVSTEIDPDAYTSVVELFDEAVSRFEDRPAYSNFGTRLSFRELDRLSRAFAAYLQQEAGVGRGDRVAVMLPNLLQFPVVLFGLLRAGAVAVNVNPLYTPRELRHQLSDSGATTMVVLAKASPVLAEVIATTPVKHVVVTQVGDLLDLDIPADPVDPRLAAHTSFRDALERGKNLELKPVSLSGDDIFALQYTGGTTGLSKGATLTHRNLVANVLQFFAMMGSSINKGEEIIVTALPLYHIFALMVNCLSFLRVGAMNLLITNPRDMPGFVAELQKHRFTAITGVNTLYNGLLHTPGFTDCDFSRLWLSIGGGAAVQRPVADKWLETTGCMILEGYGLSETSPVLTLNPPTAREFSGSIGVPLPSTDISIRDDTGLEVPLGSAGELCASGPQVMSGYWKNPEATRAAMTEDGFFCTGDIATMDEHGYFHIVDRKKDVILVSGFNVYPNEIEEVIAAHPQVVEVACVGVADADTGEAVKAYVVAKTDDPQLNESIAEHCRANLAAYKIPKQTVFIEELPKSTVGKVLRRMLRD